MTRRIAILILALALALPFAACGKKGRLEPPSGEKATYPQKYPR